MLMWHRPEQAPCQGRLGHAQAGRPVRHPARQHSHHQIHRRTVTHRDLCSLSWICAPDRPMFGRHCLRWQLRPVMQSGRRLQAHPKCQLAPLPRHAPDQAPLPRQQCLAHPCKCRGHPQNPLELRPCHLRCLYLALAAALCCPLPGCSACAHEGPSADCSGCCAEIAQQAATAGTALAETCQPGKLWGLASHAASAPAAAERALFPGSAPVLWSSGQQALL